METTFTNENLTLLLSYPFKDTDWKKKLLIGCVVGIVPILSFCLLGYISRIMQRVAAENGQPYLPEWDDWGRLFVDGVRIWVVILIGLLPTLLLMLPAMLIIYGSILIPALMTDSSSANIPPQWAIFPVLGSVGGFLLIMLGSLFSLLFSLVVPAAVSHVVAKQSIAALFHVKDWWAVWRANMGGFFLVVLLVLGISFGLTSIYQLVSFLAILCCPLYLAIIGLLSVYLCLVLYPLYAQVYRDGVRRLATQNQPKG